MQRLLLSWTYWQSIRFGWKIQRWCQYHFNGKFCSMYYRHCKDARANPLSVVNWVICCIFKGHSSWEIRNLYCLRLYSIITKVLESSLKFVLPVVALGILSPALHLLALAFWHLRVIFWFYMPREKIRDTTSFNNATSGSTYSVASSHWHLSLLPIQSSPCTKVYC